MTCYALGLYVSGAIGDRFNLRKVLAFGMCSSSIAVFMFGTLSEWLHIYNYYWYIIFWALTGLLQSTGWPTVVAIIGNWFGKSSRGLVMGFWGSSPSVGNIMGAYIAAAVLHYGYEYAFLIPAAMTFAGGIIVYFSIVSSPREVGLPEPEEGETKNTDKEPLLNPECAAINEDSALLLQDESLQIRKPKAINFFKAFLLPGVLPYSLSYACLKMVNYSFFFWLPYYLQKAYGWEEAEADSLSVWYDIGGIIGSIIGGIISDKLGTRSPVVGFLLLLSPGSLYLYYVSPANKIINVFLMSVMGFFIGGASNLISTAISADLGRQKEFSDNKEALSTVIGIIDGTGSVGAAIGQTVISVIQTNFNWKVVFYLFIAMVILTLICIIKIVYRDTKLLFQRWKNQIALRLRQD
ncbi:sugar phosphate exchanger 3-like [Centruroides sculpturatus]|uniref:sugar phosphate exchanger 3-like n=2 Tax=Centruroides sculpturatus TaxID=218467 RepID=UPI000C6DF11F|nr:sugar phosphate exchanger 3-like [Centruroides sculpturatus]